MIFGKELCGRLKSETRSAYGGQESEIRNNIKILMTEVENVGFLAEFTRIIRYVFRP